MSNTTTDSYFTSSFLNNTIIQSTITEIVESTTTIFPDSSMKITLDVFSNSTNSTSFGGNVSAEDRQLYLQELQATTTLVMIPAMTMLAILGVTGLVGNSLVMFVYTRRFKRSPTRILIITIAVFDLVANVLAIPGDIYDMFHIWDFDNPRFCRARMFFSALTTLTSAMALLAVAVIRYRKVCKPHGWQVTFRKAKFISIAVSCLGILFSVPYAILNGSQTKKTPRPDIFGHECTTDDSFVDTIWPVMNYGFFLLLFIFCCGPFTVLYILIGVKACKHSKIHGGSVASSSNTVPRVLRKASSSIDRSTECVSNAKGEVVIDVKDKSKDTESSECNSVTAEDIAMKEFNPLGEVAVKEFISLGEGKEGVEQYTVRILKDRIEIRTPIMGEFIINLQTTTPDLADHDDSQDVFEDATVNHEDESPDRDAGDSAQRQEPQSDVGTRTTQDGADPNDPSTKYDQERLEEFLNTLFNFDNNESTDDNTDEHTETTFSLNRSSEKSVKMYENADENPNSPARDKNSGDAVLGGKPSIKSKSSVSSQGSLDFDHMSALKWVDITYLQDTAQSTSTPGTSKCDPSFSFRISPSNHLLQKSDWLRNLIADVLGKTSSKPKTADEILESQDHQQDMFKLSEKESGRHKKFVDKDVDCRDKRMFTDDSSRINNTTSVKKRLKELVTKGNSILKINSQRSKTRRRPISRTTIMLIIISAVFSLGFVPHLGLMFFKFTSPEQYAAMTMAEQTLYNLFVRFFFLNCAANPIIYSLCDRNFRKECFSLLKCFSTK